MATRVVLLSDTHCGHPGLTIPPCDLLAHSGDFTRFGTAAEAEDFFTWIGRQPARARVVTAGNHDTVAQREPAWIRALAASHGVVWLEGEGADLAGLRVWASPYSPRHGAWVFQDERGAPLRARWDSIPAGLDLLLTHTPPRGVGDRIVRGEHVGCDDLRDVVLARTPRVHAFGHVHEDAGLTRLDHAPTLFVNAANFESVSVRRAASLAVRAPVVLDLDRSGAVTVVQSPSRPR